MALDKLSADTRYSFTPQYLRASAYFARRAGQIEKQQAVPDYDQMMHRGLVTAAIMQSVAAIEGEAAEVTMHGPGHHLGSGGIDTWGLQVLQPLAEEIDGQPALERYDSILQHLGKAAMDPGGKVYQDASTLVKVRNEITHYKSRWGDDMKGQTLFSTTLEHLMKHRKLAEPPWAHPSDNLLPHRFLSATTAKWAVITSSAFLGAFYDRLQIPSPLAAYLAELDAP